MEDLDLSDKIAIINWGTFLLGIIISVINYKFKMHIIFSDILAIYTFFLSGVLSIKGIIDNIKDLKLKKLFLKKLFLILNVSYFLFYIAVICFIIFISGPGV